MVEETPFQSIKITLSEEAIAMLARLRKVGYFRSDSMTIEECIRAIDYLSTRIMGNMNYIKSEKRRATNQEQSEWLRDAYSRLVRFVPREFWESFADWKSSAGT